MTPDARVPIEDSTPSIRLLLQQVIGEETKAVEADNEDTTDHLRRISGGRPRLSE